jgi:predicted amidophosphoribosyltransferase
VRKGWKTGWLFEEVRPLCRQCKQPNYREGYICSECKSRKGKHDRPSFEGYVVDRAEKRS